MITLKTLPQATAQEVFDQVTNHLLTQNEQSKQIGGTMCLYRGRSEEDDSIVLKCAAGCLIGDDEYLPVFEGLSWKDVIKDNSATVPAEHSELIGSLQRVHDTYLPHSWDIQLAVVAEQFKLNTNVLNNY